MAGTAFNSFSAHTLGDAVKVNENFDWLEGHIVPMLGGSSTNSVYDLGSSTSAWRTLYVSIVNLDGTLYSGPTDNVSTEVSAGLIRVKSGGVRGATANSSGSQREIGAGTVSSPDIRANAFSQNVSSGSGSQGTGTIAKSVSITTLGGNVLVMAHVSVRITLDGSGVGDFDVSIDETVGPSAMTGGKNNFRIAAGAVLSGVTMGAVVRVHAIDTPASAALTYNVRTTLNAGSSMTITSSQITAVELRK